MEEKIIIAGFGGQGVLSLGQLIAYAAIHDGLEVTWLPSYGPEMRGGTSNCSVVVSDKQVASPVIAKPDCLIAMNKPSLFKFESRVKEGGIIIINSSLTDIKAKRQDVKAYYNDANDIALEAGNVRTANIAVLGAYVKLRGLFSADTVNKLLSSSSPPSPKVIPAGESV